MSSSICYLNGEYLPLQQASIPVLDRGFIFGDGIYEVIPVFSGNIFRLEQHLHRLDTNLDAIRIQQPLVMQQWQDVIQQLIEKNPSTGDQSIYLQITRGVAKRDHVFPQNTVPTVFMMINPLKTPSRQSLHKGLSVITLDDIRWQNCNIKSTSLLGNILLKQQAADSDADEAILLREGVITEGSASNVFIVNGGIIKTPIKTRYLLPGITRDLVVELANTHKLACEEITLRLEELEQADEIWLSSSTRDIAPVCSCNNRLVGNGKPGPLWQTMYTIFQDYKTQLRQ